MARWGPDVVPWLDRVQALRVAFALEAADMERAVIDVAEAFGSAQKAGKAVTPGWG